MSTFNNSANAKYTIQYDLSGIHDPTVVPTRAAPGSTFRKLSDPPRFYLKLDEGETTNWLDMGESISGINLGFGAQVLKNIVGSQIQLRTISGAGGISVSQTANEIVISFTGSDTIDNVPCDPSIMIGDLAVFVGGTLYKPSSNDNLVIPYGVAGIVMAKTSLNTCDILVTGEVVGLSGFTPGAPIFISATGGFTNTCPLTGNVQQLGFAISSNRILFSPKQVLRRS